MLCQMGSVSFIHLRFINLYKKDNKPTRVRTKILEDKKKVRISALSGDQIDA